MADVEKSLLTTSPASRWIRRLRVSLAIAAPAPARALASGGILSCTAVDRPTLLIVQQCAEILVHTVDGELGEDVVVVEGVLERAVGEEPEARFSDHPVWSRLSRKQGVQILPFTVMSRLFFDSSNVSVAMYLDRWR